MKVKRVKEIMVPLKEYPVVGGDATVYDALLALKESQKGLTPGRYPHRAVLVKNAEGAIVGKIGHLAFPKSLEPKYDAIGDLQILSRAGLTPEFVSSLAAKWEILKDDLSVACGRLKQIKVSEVMRPVKENIDHNAPITEAIHRIIVWQTLSILVTCRGEVVGLLRLADLFQEVFGELMGICA